MTSPINLNQYRKDKSRDEKRKRTDENAVRFGRSKAEKDAEKAHREKIAWDLEAHKRDP